MKSYTILCFVFLGGDLASSFLVHVGDPICHCPTSWVKPVCASNGITYKHKSCVDCVPFLRIVHDGPCKEKKSWEDIPDYVNSNMGSPEVQPEDGPSEIVSPEIVSPEIGSPEIVNPEKDHPGAGSPEMDSVAESPENVNPNVESPEQIHPEVGSSENVNPQSSSVETSAQIIPEERKSGEASALSSD